jgi:hypothetical protein
VNLSFILLGVDTNLLLEATAASYGRLFPDERPIAIGADSGEVAELQFPGGSTFLTGVATPVPEGEAEAFAPMSVGALGGYALPPHFAHLILSTTAAGLDPIAELAAHTKIVAAAVVAHDGLAVYDARARATHGAEFFVAVASSTPRPLMLWTGVSVARGPDLIEILTLGMDRFQLPDMLLAATPAKATEALGFLFDLLEYAVERGVAIADGETVGRTADEKLLVTYVPSPIDPESRVASFEFL